MNWKVRHQLVFVLCVGMLLGTVSCGDSEADDKAKGEPFLKESLNIVVVPDFSNRLNPSLYPKQVNDEAIIDQIVDRMPNIIRMKNKMMHQKDRIAVKLLNPNDVSNFGVYKEGLSIDLAAFGTKQADRIKYVTGQVSPSLAEDIETFKSETRRLYSEAKSNGYTADLWGYFNQSIDDHYFDVPNLVSNSSVRDTVRNIIVIFTDGYIEKAGQTAASCPSKTCRHLNKYQIEGFRKYAKSKGEGADLKAVFKESGYGITPVKNPNLKNAEVLMLELYDRSKTKSGYITQYPSDFQILKLFWEDFFEQSGVAKYEVVETGSSVDEASQIFDAFIGLK